MDKSEVDEDEYGNIDEIEHLVIDESAAHDMPIFRLAEMQDVILIHGRDSYFNFVYYY